MNDGLYGPVRMRIVHVNLSTRIIPGPMNNASDPMLRHILEWHKILVYTEYEDYTHKYSDRGLKLNSRADDRIKFKPPWVQMGIVCDDFI